MDCGTFHKQKSRLRNSGPGTDASAFHGRQGAQVALLQSPILLAALPAYTKIKNSQAVPLTNHTPVHPWLGTVWLRACPAVFICGFKTPFVSRSSLVSHCTLLSKPVNPRLIF